MELGAPQPRPLPCERFGDYTTIWPEVELNPYKLAGQLQQMAEDDALDYAKGLIDFAQTAKLRHFERQIRMAVLVFLKPRALPGEDLRTA